MQGLSENTQAILLLCGVFGGAGQARQLSLSEYNKLALQLKDLQLQPSNLLHDDACVKEAAQNTGIDEERLAALLGRGVQLGLTLEQWQRNGVWVVSRSDDDYPQRLKQHLKAKAPPIIHGIGNRSLLQGGGLAVVGSRNVDQKGEDFTCKVGEICAKAGCTVVSGGARGVDQIAMSSAIEAGGAAIGILAEKLLRKSLDREARYAIHDERLLLISPYHPEASFSVGNAMGRNKFIYAMADYALVVSAEYGKGGTWAGAEEELKRNNAKPVFVRTGGGIPRGNSELLRKDGALPWPELASEDDFWQQLEAACKGQVTTSELLL